MRIGFTGVAQLWAPRLLWVTVIVGCLVSAGDVTFAVVESTFETRGWCSANALDREQMHLAPEARCRAFVEPDYRTNPFGGQDDTRVSRR